MASSAFRWVKILNAQEESLVVSAQNTFKWMTNPAVDGSDGVFQFVILKYISKTPPAPILEPESGINVILRYGSPAKYIGTEKDGLLTSVKSPNSYCVWTMQAYEGKNFSLQHPTRKMLSSANKTLCFEDENVTWDKLFTMVLLPEHMYPPRMSKYVTHSVVVEKSLPPENIASKSALRPQQQAKLPNAAATVFEQSQQDSSSPESKLSANKSNLINSTQTTKDATDPAIIGVYRPPPGTAEKLQPTNQANAANFTNDLQYSDLRSRPGTDRTFGSDVAPALKAMKNLASLNATDTQKNAPTASTQVKPQNPAAQFPPNRYQQLSAGPQAMTPAPSAPVTPHMSMMPLIPGFMPGMMTGSNMPPQAPPIPPQGSGPPANLNTPVSIQDIRGRTIIRSSDHSFEFSKIPVKKKSHTAAYFHVHLISDTKTMKPEMFDLNTGHKEKVVFQTCDTERYLCLKNKKGSLVTENGSIDFDCIWEFRKLPHNPLGFALIHSQTGKPLAVDKSAKLCVSNGEPTIDSSFLLYIAPNTQQALQMQFSEKPKWIQRASPWFGALGAISGVVTGTGLVANIIITSMRSSAPPPQNFPTQNISRNILETSNDSQLTLDSVSTEKSYENLHNAHRDLDILDHNSTVEDDSDLHVPVEYDLDYEIYDAHDIYEDHFDFGE